MAATASDDDEAITGINVTPLVDIVLVLLIIFMLTASYIVQPAIHVDLPRAASAEATVQSLLSLVITKEGKVYLNNREVDDAGIRAFLRAEKANGQILEAVIAADASVTHGQVVHVIDLIKQEGVEKFALNTQAEFSSPPAEPLR